MIKHWSYNNVPEPQITNRGFTGHEHLDEFNLIDMNGRMYDPVTAGFLSPDPFVADPFSSQSFNGYSYCVNNPLRYTDPTGYVRTAYNITSIDPSQFSEFLNAYMKPGGSLDLAISSVNHYSNTLYYDDQTGMVEFWLQSDGLAQGVAFAPGYYACPEVVENSKKISFTIQPIDAYVFQNELYAANGGGWSPYNLSGEARLAMAMAPRWLGLPNFPDAISIELNGSAGAVVATNTSPIGGLIKLNGNINGSSAKGYLQGSAGLGTVFASADVILTQYYVLGPNASKVTMEDFNGTFFSGNIGIDAGISLGAGVSWSTPFTGAHIIGISSSVGVGVSLTVVSGGLYWGQMDFYSNHMK